uniref:hypothetical protein n=1 Tax=Alistipes shahii TaxID=328814 RepID=UPI003FF0D3EF
SYQHRETLLFPHFVDCYLHLSTSFKPVVNNPVASVPVMPEVSKASACRIAPCPAANEYSHLS